MRGSSNLVEGLLLALAESAALSSSRRHGEADPSSLSFNGWESESPLSSAEKLSSVSVSVKALDCDSHPLSRLPLRLTPLGWLEDRFFAADKALTTGSKKEKVFPEP